MDSSAEAVVKYALPRAKTTITLAEAEALSRALADRLAALAPRIDVAVGLANGALLPTRVVADRLGIPCRMVKVRRRGSRWLQRLTTLRRRLRIPAAVLIFGPVAPLLYVMQRRFGQLEAGGFDLGFDVAGRHVALIDDCIVTGASIRHVKAQLEVAGAASVRVAVICWSDERRRMGAEISDEPDVFLHRTVHFYPWSSISPELSAFEAWVAGHGLEIWT